MTRGAMWLALFLVPSAAFGQVAPPDTAVVPIPETVVRALRGEDHLRDIPATAFVIPRAALERSAAPRLSSLLTWLPGLYGYQSSASGDPTVVDPRGFTANGESSYLKVLVNGRETRDLENGNVDWDWLGPESVDRLEVVEGPGAWVYGDGSEGGILNIIRDETRRGFDPRGTLRFGSFDQRGGSFGSSWGGGPWGVSLGGGGRDVDGWRERSRERVRNGHALASWRAEDGRTTVSLDGSWLATRRENPGALTSDQMAADRTQAENPGDYLDSDRGLATLEVIHGDPARGQWTLAPYLRVEDFRQVRTIFVPLYHPSSGATWGTDLAWRGHGELAGIPMRLAATYDLESARLVTRYYDPTAGDPGALVAHGWSRRLTQSGSASAQIDLLPGVTARAGIRMDALRMTFRDQLSGEPEQSRTLSAASPFLGLSVRSGSGTAFVSASGGFHAPTLNQLDDRRPFATGLPPPLPPFITISNRDLEPQRSIDYEVGGRWDAPSGLAASLTFYEIFVRDEIDFDLGTFSYSNIGKSRHAGFLASARTPLAKSLSLVMAGTLAPTTISGGQRDGNQINAVPIGSALGRLEWAPAPWAAADLGARWVARQYLDTDNEHPLADFATVELGAALRHGPGRLKVRVANLLDRKYADTGFIDGIGNPRFVPAAGRSVTAALSFE